MEFEHFVLARGEALLRFAVMLCGDRGRAEDLVQTTLLRIYPQWDRVAAMARPEAYVRTVLARAHVRWWRRRASAEIPAQMIDDAEPDRTDLAQRLADRDEAWELLRRLPHRQRAVLVLRYYEDLPDSAIAQTLGCRESTVRSQAARGLATLRTSLSTVDQEGTHDRS